LSSLAVIVPVKSSGAKSRLSTVLSEGERRALARSLFMGVMGALARAGVVGSCRVVSSDPETLRSAGALGARPVAEGSDSGVNSAVRRGMEAARDADEFLVLPSDLPLLRASDVRELLRLRAAGPRVVIAPSTSFDGTNALLFPRAPRFPLSYDSDSFWNHLAGASALGIPAAVCARAGLMFDVDSPSDLRRLARTRVGGEGARPARRSTL
jgi:2-phospho-L-lactate guanylyltransferase